MPQYKNKYVSYSRLSRFEQCPLSFKFQYIDKLKSTPGIPLIFGSAVHAVLEQLYKEAIEKQSTVKLSEDRALSLWQEQCIQEGLTGLEIFEEGANILKSYVANAEPIRHGQVIAIESEFSFPVGNYDVKGFIDRVDRINDETIEIVDYKTNRIMFSREEVDTSLQFSIYHAAARKLWPWAKNIKLSFEMLRHGVKLTTVRTEEQIDTAMAYVDTLAQMTEKMQTYTARLNNNCIYCDHSANCPEYQKAVKTETSQPIEQLTTIEEISQERERLAKVTKILYARKKRLDDMIRAHLADHSHLETNGMMYKMINTQKKSYPIEKALDVLVKRSGLDREEIIRSVLNVDRKAVERFLKEKKDDINKSTMTMIKAELDAIAEVKYSPRLFAKASEM